MNERLLLIANLCIFYHQSNLVGSGPMSKTLDMDGREQAVGMIEKMADGFEKVEVPDPNKLKEFIEGVTGSVMAIMEGLNGILYENDPSAIPLTDFEKAADMPYDTDIPEGKMNFCDNLLITNKKMYL